MRAPTSRRRFVQHAALAGVGAAPFVRRSFAPAQGATIYDVRDFGAQGDGRTNDAGAIQQTIDRCAADGGGTVLLPAGHQFLTGSLVLKSHVNLHLEHGAELRASLNPDDYQASRLIEAIDATHVSITGRGTINAQGRQFMHEERPHIFRPKSWRPRMMVLENCHHLRIQDVTLQQSALWTVHLAGCTDVAVQGLSILNDRKVPNCDGIAVDCSKNVRISDCHIEAGDDCIVLKTVERFAQYGPCENVTVTNCTLASTSAAVKIGSETVNDVRNLLVTNCVVRDSHRGLGIMLRDQGTVENIMFSNITVETRYFHDDWWGAAEPIYVTSMPRERGRPVGTVRNVRFSNILCRSENGAFIRGSAASRPEGIVLENVQLQLAKWTDETGGRHDVRPWDQEGAYEHPSAGVYCRQAHGVTLDRCRVTWDEDPPSYFRHALEVHGVRDLEKIRFTGDSAHPDRYPAEQIG